MNRNGSPRSLDDWLARVSTLSLHEIELGLERVATVLERLAIQRPGLVIHVGGTNGKGSCVAMLEAFLHCAGLRVGGYTSPHLRRYNERIRIDREDADDAVIIAAFERVDAARRDVPLTYFEFGTLVALAVFETRRCDAIVLEVGMGGRLDAVNAVDPDAGIITNIGLDHCEWLGRDIEAIAGEKAGILRRGKPFVFGSPELPRAIARRAAELGTDLRVAGRDFSCSIEAGDGGTWSWTGRCMRITGLEKPALAAVVQVQNAAGVLALLEALDRHELLQRRLINEVLGSVQVEGRMQLLHTGREWLLDVAHNPDAARVLAASLARRYPVRRIVAVVGMLDDKDAEAIVDALAPLVDAWVAVTAASPRALPAARLAATIARRSNKPCLIADDIRHGLDEAAVRAEPADLLLVFGSFYVVGPALDELYSRREGGPGHCDN